MDSLEKWMAEVKESPEYKRELFLLKMRKAYRKEEWRKTVIKEFKSRRRNNLNKNIGRGYSGYAKYLFEYRGW